MSKNTYSPKPFGPILFSYLGEAQKLISVDSLNYKINIYFAPVSFFGLSYCLEIHYTFAFVS